MKSIQLEDHNIGPGHPCFIIAEAGVNHNGDVNTAMQLVDAASAAGADAIKFQTFKAEKLLIRDAPKADYQKKRTGNKTSQFEMLKQLELSDDSFRTVAEYCRKKRILFLSTPFDEASADMLLKMNVPAYKIGSGDLTNLPLIDHVAKTGKPLILSTGMAGLSEVQTAVKTVKEAGNDNIILLHCVSCYPADPADVNLLAMLTLEETFHLPIGYSDHSLGIEIAIGAAALGACVVEKHVTLDKSMEGPDHAASIEPRELTAMIYAIRKVEMALGSSKKIPVEAERKIADVARRSLVAARDIPEGKAIEREDLAIKRPGTGMSPAMLPQIMGRIAASFIPEGIMIKEEMLS